MSAEAIDDMQREFSDVDINHVGSIIDEGEREDEEDVPSPAVGNNGFNQNVVHVSNKCNLSMEKKPFQRIVMASSSYLCIWTYIHTYLGSLINPNYR